MKTAREDDPNAKSLYRVGGLSALAIAIGYLVTIPIYAAAGIPPEGAESWLRYGADKTAAWSAILGLSVLTDVLFIPLALALYFALKGVDRGAMLLGAAFILLFVAVDLSVTWPNYAALISLSRDYGAATTEAQRAADVTAASYAWAVVSSDLESFYSIGTLAIGILIVGIVMLRTSFSRAGAWLGIATGVGGLVAVVGPLFVGGLGIVAILVSLLTTIWLLVTGYRLVELGRAPLTTSEVV